MEATERARVLVVEDVHEVQAMLVASLAAGGYSATGVADARGMRQAMDADDFDLVLLDLRLPDADGLGIARALRQKSGIGIIMVSSHGAPHERARGLEAGADDYIAKPVYPRELLARVRNVLERGRQHRKPGRRFAGWVLDKHNRLLCREDSGEIAGLTRAEFNLLCALADRPGQIVSRDMLAELLGAHAEGPNPRKIDVLVSRVRQKLAFNGDEAAVIQTCRGYGYRFVARIDG